MVEIKAYQVRYIGLVHILMYVSYRKLFYYIETLMYIFYKAIAFYYKFSLEKCPYTRRRCVNEKKATIFHPLLTL